MRTHRQRIGVTKIVLLAAVAALPALPQQPAVRPWWKDTQVVTLSASPPALDDLVTVVGWGETAETAVTSAYLKRRAQRLHRFGRKIIGSMSIYDAAWETYRQRPELAASAVIDVDGRPMTVEWESTPTQPLAWCNTNAPVWQDFLLEQGRRLVDAGVDGIVLDEIDGTAGSVGRGGSFGEPDMTMFRRYLVAHYTRQELSSRYGIDDPSTFHYGNYIRGRGLARFWRSEPWKVPLSRDFTRFQREASADFMERLVTSTRDYAVRTYGRTVTFSANLYGFYPNLIEYAGLMDYFTLELPVVENGYPSADHVVIDHKMARALGQKPAWGLLSVATVADLQPRGPMSNLIRLLSAESYAAGGALVLPYQNYGWSPESGPVWFEGDSAAQRPYYSFFKENAALLADRTPLAHVALLYSQPTELEFWERYRAAYRGTALALLDSRIQFDVALLGSGGNVPEWPGDDRLDGYTSAVLPSASCLSGTQVDRLLAWATRGGTLIITGGTGTCDFNGDAVSYAALRPFAAEGKYRQGLGRVIRMLDDPGTAYRQDRSPVTRERLATILRDVSDPVVSADGGPGVLVLADSALGGQGVMLHLLNGNYKLSVDLVKEADPFQLLVSLPPALRDAADLRAYRLSPDRPGVDLLPLALAAGGQALIDCPAVKGYDVIVLLPATAAKQLTVDRGGQLLSALAETARRGGDMTPFNSLQTPLEEARSAGNQLEAARLAGRAAAELERSNRIRVLMDESHDEQLTLSVLRAPVIDSSTPAAAMITTLQRTLSGEFKIEPNTTAPLTLALLNRHDVLLLAAPRAHLTDSELKAVNDYVKAGGGLVVLGGCGANVAASGAVTKAYGIAFETGCVFDTNDGGTWTLFNADVTPHPAMVGVSFLSANGGGSLTLTSPALSLIRTGRTTWQDLNRDRNFTPGEPIGPFTVAAAAESGSGRVVAAASRTFADANADFFGNDAFLASALRWAARPAGGGAHSTVSAASMRPGPLAPEMIANTYGVALATSSASAPAQSPLPAALAGTTVRVIDQTLREGYAQMFAVAPGQVSWLVPDWISGQSAAVIVRNGSGLTNAAVLDVAPVAPGVFAANGSGTGIAAGTLLRVRDGVEPDRQPLAQPSAGGYVPVPVGFGPESEKLYLNLTGTGLRRAAGALRVSIGTQAVPVTLTPGGEGVPGLDPIEVGPLPRTLAGQGRVEVVVSVEGRQANAVNVEFK